MKLAHARGELDLDRCVVMGILNRTPDSFFDGGRMELDSAVEHGLALVSEGAGILDLGAVKAGPGEEVTEDEETRRLIPLVEELAARTEVPLSIETGRPEVARRAIEAGAAIVNDVTGLMDEELADVSAATGAGLILMHHGGQIRGRPRHPRYEDVAREVGDELVRLASVAQDRGRPARRRSPSIPASISARTRCIRWSSCGGPRSWSLAVTRCWWRPPGRTWWGRRWRCPRTSAWRGPSPSSLWRLPEEPAMVRVHDVEASVRVVRMVEAIEGKSTPEAPVRGLWD